MSDTIEVGHIPADDPKEPINEIAGIPVNVFEEPIFEALDKFAGRTHQKIFFDGINEGIKLVLAPEDVPYSARADIKVEHKIDGRITEAGNLAIIAFAPGDGTGDELTYSLSDIDTGSYPREAKVVPTSKVGVNSEVHLPISSHVAHHPLMGWVIHSNNLHVLEFRPNKPHRLAKIGELGYSPEIFNARQGWFSYATFTTGHYNLLGNHSVNGERFGDPQAIYNPWDRYVQIAGFLALTDEMAAQHFSIFDRLGANHT